MKFLIDPKYKRRSNATSRDKLTLFERKCFMHEHRCNESGSIIQRLLPYYQFGFPELLREAQREQLWQQVSYIVKRCERSHFKRLYQDEDKHCTRILTFYELAQARWDKTPAWIISSYKYGFAEIEALIQLRQLGVSLDEYDNKGVNVVSHPILQYRRWFVKVFVQYFTIERRKEHDPTFSYEKLYLERYGSWPCIKTVKLYNARVRVLVQAINMSSEKVFGFSSPRSLDSEHNLFYESETIRFNSDSDGYFLE